MYSTSEKEKEFFEKKAQPQNLSDLKELSDRELLEIQTLYLSNIQKSNERIKLNIQFWFYFGLILFVISLLFTLNK